MPTIDQKTAEMQKLSPLARLRKEREIKPLVAAAETALEHYEAATLLHADQLDPARAVADFQRGIGQAKSAAEITELQARIATIQISKDEVRRTAERLCLTAYEPAHAALVALVEKAGEVLGDYAVEADTAEELFFDSFGLPRQVTTVSSRVESLRAQVQGWRESLAAHRLQSGLRAVTSPIVEALKVKP